MVNTTFMDTSNTILDIVIGVNSNMNNTLGIVFLTIIFFVMFIVFQQYPIKQILLYQGFLLSLIGSLLWFGGFLAFSYLMIPLVLFFMMIFVNIYT